MSPELCVDPEAGLALTPSVNHVRRRDLEALTSNGKLHKSCPRTLPRLVCEWLLRIVILLCGLRVQRCCSCWRRAGYARGKARVTKHRSSAALLIQTFCGPADRGPDDCGTLVINAER